MTAPVSLQINLAPGDYPSARLILPHQLRKLSGQVDEIILTVDTRPGRGRFAAGWEANEQRLYDFLEKIIKPHYKVTVSPVDYSETTKSAVAAYFFGTTWLPDKDFRGGPFYAYFFGLYTASNDFVFHLDADMFLGGGSETWVDEAVRFMHRHPECLFVSPLPGPPHKNDVLISQNIIQKIAPFTYVLGGMSTRIFMTNKSILCRNPLALEKPGIKNQLKASLQGHPNADLPEHLFTKLMNTRGFSRVDFLGTDKGLWSLHPPYRTQTFYNNLPAIIENIETLNLPDNQYGFYDIVDEFCDWSEARLKLKTNKWWKRK